MKAPRASVFHSRFTPSLLPRSTLEALFVQRSALLERILAQIAESATTRTKHQLLLVGPRGIGKTHLLSLTYHRVRADEALRARLCLAWLREEEWGVDSFFELLRRILLALDREYPQGGLRAAVEALREAPRETVRQRAQQLLQRFLGDRTLLVLCENLDDLFAGMGEQGQGELRSFLQESGSCMLLATAQSLFDGVSRQTAPFYGFFRTDRLQGLSFDEAVELVRRLARHGQDEELEEYLDTSDGRARLRAIQHLSGGNHRIYVVLSQVLTRKSLDELVPSLMDLLDALTPYYQSRMQVLEAPQRKLVEAMCARRGAATVEELAKDGFLDCEATGRWLRDLAGKGYASIRGSHEAPLYELQEPLLRLCLELKAEREEPLRLLVEFLRLWYTPQALQERIALLPPAALERSYIQVALARGDATREVIAACLQDYVEDFEKGDFQKAARAAEDLLAVDPDSATGWLMRIISLTAAGQHEEALAVSEQHVHAKPDDPWAIFMYADQLMTAHRWEDGLPLLRGLIDGELGRDALVRSKEALCLIHLQQWSEAEFASRELLRLEPDSRVGRHLLAGCLYNLQRYPEAMALYEGFAWEYEADPNALANHAALLLKLGRLQEAEEFVERALKLEPSSWQTLLLRGEVYFHQGHVKESIRSVRAALETSPETQSVPEFWRIVAELWLRVGQMQRALQAMDTLLQLSSNEEQSYWALANRAAPFLALGRVAEAEQTLRAALGHRPTDAAVLSNLGAVLMMQGRFADAEAALRGALQGAQRTDAMTNLSELLGLQGRHSEALDLMVKLTGLAPREGSAWGAYGRALVRAGNLAKAHDAFTYGFQHGDTNPVSRYEAIGVQIARHRWPEAVEALRQRLGTMTELEIEPFRTVVNHLFRTRENAAEWPERCRKLVSLFRRHNKVPFLAQAVTRTIELLRAAAPEDRQRWLTAWKASGEKEPQMRPALRLLEGAVRYLENPGPQPLLRLPLEERTLLMPLLQLQTDPTQPDG